MEDAPQHFPATLKFVIRLRRKDDQHTVLLSAFLYLLVLPAQSVCRTKDTNDIDRLVQILADASAPSIVGDILSGCTQGAEVFTWVAHSDNGPEIPDTVHKVIFKGESLFWGMKKPTHAVASLKRHVVVSE